MLQHFNVNDQQQVYPLHSRQACEPQGNTFSTLDPQITNIKSWHQVRTRLEQINTRHMYHS